MIGRERRRSGSWLLAQVTSTLARTATPGPVRRAALSILGIVGVVAFVLGFVGWTHLANSDPALSADRIAVLYRTVQLFIGEDGGVFSVPWTLDIARIVAPLVIPLLGSVAVLGFAAAPLNRLGGRTAARHVVVIGPAERARLHLRTDNSDALTAEGHRIEVHADTDGTSTLIGPLHVPIDAADDAWVQRVNAHAARRVVIATGRDDTNMQMLDLLVESAVGAELIVEMSTADAQRWLSLALAHTHPEADVKVVCLEASQRRDVVDQVIASSRLALDPSAPCAVIGDAADVAVLATELARDLAAAHVGIVRAAFERDPRAPIGASRRFDVVGAADPDAVRSALDAHHDAIAGILHVFVDAHTIDEIARRPGLVALVADDDSEQAVRTAAQISSGRPDVEVFVRATDLQRSPLPRVTVVGNDREVLRHGAPDPVMHLARLLHEIRNPEGSDTEWTRLGRDLRRRLVRDAKRVITDLPDAGFSVTAGDGPEDLPDEHEIDGIARVLVGAHAPLTDTARHDAANLPHVLARAGLRLTRTVMTDDRSTDDGLDVLPAEVVDLLARRVHEQYLDDLHHNGRLDEANPSHVPWVDLPVEVRLQNAHHVLHAVATLNQLGCRVSQQGPSAGEAVVHDLGDEVVENWAQREHARWMSQKLAQGCVYGPDDAPDAEPPTHPELLAWGALSDESRDKHRRPVGRLLQILAEGGLVVVRSAIAEAPPIA